MGKNILHTLKTMQYNNVILPKWFCLQKKTKNQNLIKRKPDRQKSTYILKTWLIYSLISQYLHYMMLQRRVNVLSLFYFLPLPDRFLDHLIYIQYIERRPGEICREKLPGKSCVVEIYDITYVQTSLMKCRADVMATLLPSAKS